MSSPIIPAEVVDIATTSTQSYDIKAKKQLLFSLILFLCLICAILVVDSIWIILGIFSIFIPLLFSLSVSITQATKNRIHSGGLRWASRNITDIQEIYRHYSVNQILQLAKSEIDACHKKRKRVLVAVILLLIGMIGILFGVSSLPNMWANILYWSGFGLLIGLDVWWTRLSAECIRVREYWTLILDVRQELDHTH